MIRPEGRVNHIELWNTMVEIGFHKHWRGHFFFLNFGISFLFPELGDCT
jgi:hypothetical protein